MSNPIYLLTDFSCCEDFEAYLKAQNHANREILDAITAQAVEGWNKKACNLAIKGGNLCLLDKDGETLAYVSAVLQDDDTITRDPETGKVTCVRVKVQGLDIPVGFWMGTREQYKKLSKKSPNDTAYFFTDLNLCDVYDLVDRLASWATSVKNGTSVVKNAEYAKEAGKAANADNAANATNANYAVSAGVAANANYAASAGNATNANHAASADNATSASTALNATYAGEASRAQKAKEADNAKEAEQINNGGTIFSRKSIWKGSKSIAANASANISTSENAGGKYLIIETKGFRTYPICFDIENHTSVSVTFGTIEVRMVNQNPKNVQISNKGQSAITVTNIFVEL